MRLRKIKIRGFKSFADTVDLDIRDNLIGIVGPNGCGKSNIADAVRWCLGEGRLSVLRAEASDDVMFAGNDRRPSASEAMVELHFQLEATETEVAKRLATEHAVITREFAVDTGSIYKINGKEVRRKDVASLIAGTGISLRAYGMIGQGMAGHIAEAEPAQLQEFLEEAANVSHVRVNYKDTIRKLAGTKESLAQVANLIAQVQKQANSLNRACKLAERYQHLSAQINVFEHSWLDHQLEVLQQHQTSERGVISSLQQQIASSQDNIRQAQEQVEALTKRRQVAQADCEQAIQQVNAAERTLQQLQLSLEYSEKMRLQKVEQLDREHSESARLVSEQSEINVQLAQAKGQLQAIGPQIEELKALGDALSEQQTQIEPALFKVQAEKLQLSDKIISLEKNIESESRHLRLLQAGQEKIGNEAGFLIDNRNQLQVDMQRRKQLDEQAVQLQDKSAQLVQDLATSEQALTDGQAKIVQLREERSANEHELAGKQENLRLLQTLIPKQANLPDTQGALAKLIELTDVKYAAALDAALGNFAAALVVEDLSAYADTHAKQLQAELSYSLIAYTASSNDGASKAQASSKLPVQSPDFYPQLADKVGRKEYLPLLASMLSTCYLVDDLAAGIKLREQLLAAKVDFDFKVITYLGRVINRHGLLWSGSGFGRISQEQQAKVLQAEIQALKDRNSTLQDQARDLAQSTKPLLKQRDNTHQAVQKINQQVRAQEQELVKLQVRIDYETEAAADFQQRNARLVEERAELVREQQAAEDIIGKQKVELSELQTERQRINKQQETLEVAKRKVIGEDERIRVQLEKCEKEMSVASISIEHLSVQYQNNEQLLERVQLRLSDLSQMPEVGEDQQVQNKQDIVISDQQLRQLNEHLATLKRAVSEIEQQEVRVKQQQVEQSAQLQQMQDQVADLRVAAAAGHEKINTLTERKTQLPPMSDDKSILESLPEPAQLEDQLADLQLRREKLGAINFAAHAEYEEVKQKLEQMLAQQDDVLSAIEQLQSGAGQLADLMQERMDQMFSSINMTFTEDFVDVFSGGSAKLIDLSKVDDSEIRQEGYAIEVQLPGKKKTNIRSLSGGEKAACALAFIVTLMRNNPPPFCVLDEVDAALDDNRSYRFVLLLRKLTTQSVFFLVTHNRVVIEMVDRLIGVTQQERGVSKLVSVDMQQALEAVARRAD